MTAQIRTSKWKRWPFVLLAAVLAAAALLFLMFEPVFLYSSGWTAFDRPAHPPMQSETLDPAWQASGETAQATVRQSYLDSDIPAISAAVAVNGQLVWRTAIGYADLETASPVSLDDRFRIGSTSKAVTAVAIGVLLNDVKLSLDTPLRELDPSLPKAFDNISIGQAMSHRAGIRNYGVCLCFPVWEHLNRRSFRSVRDSVGVIENSKPLSQPGERYAYTSLGFNLAGLAIEKASGATFQSFLETNVFAPLSMKQSALDSLPNAPAERVGFYETNDNRYKRVARVDNSIRWPSGGVLSSPSDMVRLGSAMLDDRLLSASARSALLTIPLEGREDSGQSYAHGWRVSDWRLPGDILVPAYHHNGTAVGSTSVFVVLPEENMVVSVMMNKGAESTTELAAIANQIVPAFRAPQAAPDDTPPTEP